MKKPIHRPFAIEAIALKWEGEPGLTLHGSITDPTTKIGRRRIYSRLDLAQAEALRDRLTDNINRLRTEHPNAPNADAPGPHTGNSAGSVPRPASPKDDRP